MKDWDKNGPNSCRDQRHCSISCLKHKWHRIKLHWSVEYLRESRQNDKRNFDQNVSLHNSSKRSNLVKHRAAQTITGTSWFIEAYSWIILRHRVLVTESDSSSFMKNSTKILVETTWSDGTSLESVRWALNFHFSLVEHNFLVAPKFKARKLLQLP